ncbi:MAG TPA: hypothetical protein VGE77_07545, partial [Nocardioides sp.]
LLAACDGDAPAPAGVVTPTEDSTAADLDRVDEALAAIGAAHAEATGAGTTHPGLAPALAPLLAVHAAHLALLSEATGADAPSDPPPTPPPSTEAPPPASATDPVAALAALRTTETALAGTLTDLAVAADSGPLARTLAAMAAAVDQQLLLLARAAA